MDYVLLFFIVCITKMGMACNERAAFPHEESLWK